MDWVLKQGMTREMGWWRNPGELRTAPQCPPWPETRGTDYQQTSGGKPRAWWGRVLHFSPLLKRHAMENIKEAPEIWLGTWTVKQMQQVQTGCRHMSPLQVFPISSQEKGQVSFFSKLCVLPSEELTLEIFFTKSGIQPHWILLLEIPWDPMGLSLCLLCC